MVAAPQYATLVIATNGSNINVDVYLSDVVGGEANFDSGNAAGSTSKTYYKCPVNGMIVDFSIKTGMTDTTAGRFTINGSPTKSVIRWANHLNTLNNRPQLNIPVSQNEDIGLVQLS